MQSRADEAGIALRPHAKTHKSVDIARRQLAAGAVGQCCAKIGEAEVLAEEGIGGILITSPIAAPAAIRRLAVLAAWSAGLMAVVDHPDVAARIDDALWHIGARLDVLIDIDPGVHRSGVASPDAAVQLAQAIAASRCLRLVGVQFYCSLEQHIQSFAGRLEVMNRRAAYLKTCIDALRTAGYEIPIISGSGTGTHVIDLEMGLFTELQVGSYIFMDKQYLDCDLGPAGGTSFQTSLFIDARVVSANHPDMVTIDAGFKSLATDGGVATVASGAPQDASVRFMGDEHSAVMAPGIGRVLKPGHAMSLVVPHCDPTVNLHDCYHVVREGTLIGLWPVSARGRAR